MFQLRSNHQPKCDEPFVKPPDRPETPKGLIPSFGAIFIPNFGKQTFALLEPTLNVLRLRLRLFPDMFIP